MDCLKVLEHNNNSRKKIVVLKNCKYDMYYFLSFFFYTQNVLISSKYTQLNNIAILHSSLIFYLFFTG